MKQPRFEQSIHFGSPESPAAEIAREFARIAKLTEGGKVSEVWSAANALYAKYPKDHTANFIMALVLKENRQNNDALPFAEAAVKFAPDNARNLVFLGKLYVDLRMIEYAPKVLNKAFAIDKTLFQAPWALAHYYLESGQGRLALPYFGLALQAAPADLKNKIIMDRAVCLRDMGKVSEAGPEFEKLLKDPSVRIQALTRLVLLKKHDQTSNYAGEIRKELERTDLNAKNRSMLLLCLGRLHENGRDFDNAFLNFEKSRKLLTGKFDAARFLALIDDAMSTTSRGIFDKARKFGHESEKPIFVVGMPRSGTTMTEQIIAAHSQAEGVGELRRMITMASRFTRPNGMRQALDKMAEVGPERWKEVPQMYLNLLNALAPAARYAVDKLPHNFLYLGFIHLCFPNARIIHCMRNPLDSFISSFQNEMSAFHSYSYDQRAYGEYYINYLKLMDHWKAAMPDSIYELRYETLTANPEAEVRNILDFLGLPWEESCLRFNEREATVKTFSRLQVRNPINTGSVGRWRNYEKHLGPILGILKNAGIPVDEASGVMPGQHKVR